MRLLLYSFFATLCSVSIFSTSSLFVTSLMSPKWYGSLFCALPLLLLVLGRAAFSGKREKVKTDQNILFEIIAAVSMLQALYGILQYAGLLGSHSDFRVTGSFDNPAGFAACLSIGFPFCLLTHREKCWKQTAFRISAIVIAVAIVLCGSRAGTISITFVLGLMIFKRLQLPLKMQLFIAIGLFLVLLAGLYFLKKDSANGRILVWKCSLQMVKDKPILGFGTNGFRKNYMLYQANYFKEHPSSEYASLADNNSVNSPFNEYLRILINYGIVGFALLVVAAIFLWRLYRRHKTKSWVPMNSLMTIAVFALFSYPFNYPFVWIITLFNAFIIVRNSEYFYVKIRKCCRILFILLIPFCFFTFLHYVSIIKAEMQWCKLARLSLYGQFEALLPQYRQLYGVLSNDPFFLYNYSAMLNDSKRYQESLCLAKECERLLASYDLQLLLGNNYMQLKQFEKAEFYYRRASAMCPVRFTPLYELCHLYELKGDSFGARKLAIQILNKPVKVESDDILIIKSDMKEFLRKSKPTI